MKLLALSLFFASALSAQIATRSRAVTDRFSAWLSGVCKITVEASGFQLPTRETVSQEVAGNASLDIHLLYQVDGLHSISISLQ